MLSICAVSFALWAELKTRRAAASGERRRPAVLVSESVRLLWSRSYLAARQVLSCQQLLELVRLFDGWHLELTSAAHINRSGDYLLSSLRLWAPKGTSGTLMKREILYKCFGVSSLVSKEQNNALHEVVICASEKLLVLYFINIRLHVSTSYMVILRPLLHIKPKLQLQISFWVRMRYRSYCCTVSINKI